MASLQTHHYCCLISWSVFKFHFPSCPIYHGVCMYNMVHASFLSYWVLMLPATPDAMLASSTCLLLLQGLRETMKEELEVAQTNTTLLDLFRTPKLRKRMCLLAFVRWASHSTCQHSKSGDMHLFISQVITVLWDRGADVEMGRSGENALRHTVRVVKLSCSRSQATRRRYISFLQVLCGHSSNFYLLVLCFGCVESLFEFLSKCVYGDSSPLAVLSNISHFCLKEGITSTSDGCLVPASDVFNARISRIWCGGEHSCPSFPLYSNQ